MVGIYKINNPSNHSYIGQSWDIQKRFKVYKRISQSKGQPALYNSFIKHGIDNHNFQVVYELPSDVDQKILDSYEQFFINQFKECGIILLNSKGGGQLAGGKFTRLVIDKIIKTKAGKDCSHSEETKAKIRAKRALQIIPKGIKKNKPAWNKGKKIGDKCRRIGYIVSQETREKLRLANLGKKLSQETIAKRTATSKANYLLYGRRPYPESARKLKSELYKGRPSPNKGKRFSKSVNS